MAGDIEPFKFPGLTDEQFLEREVEILTDLFMQKRSGRPIEKVREAVRVMLTSPDRCVFIIDILADSPHGHPIRCPRRGTLIVQNSGRRVCDDHGKGLDCDPAP